MSYDNFNNRVSNIVTTKDEGTDIPNSGIKSGCNTATDISIEKVYTKGEDGVGIEDILFNEDGSITIKLSNDVEFTSDSLKGDKGESITITESFLDSEG